MPNQGTESQFEATTIERLAALGYRYEYGGGIPRELHEVVITDWIRSFLAFRYPHLNAEAIEGAVLKASRPEGVTAVQRTLTSARSSSTPPCCEINA